MHYPDKGQCSGWCPVPVSPPHPFVKGVLRGQCAVESGVSAPSACDIAEIALRAALPAKSCTSGQGFNRYIVQAFALLTRSPAKSLIHTIRNIADGVLHALIVGTVGYKCKREVGKWISLIFAQNLLHSLHRQGPPLIHSSDEKGDGLCSPKR